MVYGQTGGVWVDGWVQACANGRVGCMGGFIDGYGWFYGMGGIVKVEEYRNAIISCNFSISFIFL
jgi:hypothetical protein